MRALALLLIVLALPQPVLATDPVIGDISEIIVTSQRQPQVQLLHSANIEQLDAGTLERVQHQHIHELMNRVAGVWVVRGSGQEHQTAMRSPVLGGAGACGGFLILEDSIPIRPASFCNISQLMEVNAEQASSVEVVRGPGNALFGSNAVHGIVNVLMPSPGDESAPNAAIEMGSNDYFRVRATTPFTGDANWLATAIYANDGGFRDSSGYSQSKLHLKRNWLSQGGDFTLALSATNLRQDSAGFIVGEDAYKDRELSRSNPNPDAFRDADSARLYGIWTRSLPSAELDIRPYIRRSKMRFLHHAMPGQPVEENGQVSAGLISAVTFSRTNSRTVTGIDLEWSDMYLEQFQAGPTAGSPMQRATRPQGWHYDYSATSLTGAAFVQTEINLGERTILSGGMRFEYTHYDYRNHMVSGNTRDDGSVCGAGGCLYSRPGDREDTFQNISPNLSANFRINTNTSLFVSLAHGFRAPQSLELYRLQNGQLVTDLDSESVGSAELGLRKSSEGLAADIVVYAMQKRDSVFRDSEGFNVSGARSRHRGIEATVNWQAAEAWRLYANLSYAQHTYDFSAVGRGEDFVKGNDIDTAPRWLGSAELMFEPTTKLRLGLQVTAIGSYFLEPGNQFKYSGHVIGNLRAGIDLSNRTALVLRVNNVTDERIADRADYASRQYRYLPGRGREAFIEIRFSPFPL
jgi:iron complex outermembrane receptor protein